MIILLDAMGGDNAPDANIKGAVKAVNEVSQSTEILLIGKEDVINNRVKELYNKEKLSDISPRLKIYNATETIEMEDTPTVAIKHKKDSSMVVGFNLLKEGKGDVFISAGNSGALLTGATLLVGRIKGIDRPALAGILPAYKSQLLLMDCGSNTNCKPINLLQFAQMASIYLRNTFGIEKHAFSGKVDAVVTDGFTGNIFLKTTEGLGKFVKVSLTDSLKRNFLSILGSIPCLPAINRFAKTMDYKIYGGALFLGVKKPVVKAHGSSDDRLFEYTIIQAEKFVENKAVEKMTEEFLKQKENNA